MRRQRPHNTRDRRKPRNEKAAGATFDVTIERILPGGFGLAHAEGLTLFVSLAAPGDRVRVRVDHSQGRVAFASIREVLSPSALRVEAPCPYFGRCGGCDFQQLNYDAQLTAKVDIIRDCLHRIGKIEFSDEIPITGSPKIWGYRSRAQWQHDSQRKQLGYFERASRRVCDVAECPVLAPDLQSTLANLRADMKESLLPEEATEIQAVAADDGVSLWPPLPGQATRVVRRHVAVDDYFFSAESFFQTNHELLEPLIASATSEAAGDSAIDLYCGVGLFTLPLARRFDRVFGVEAHASAIGFARHNAEAAGLDNVTFELARTGDWLAKNNHSLASVDFVLLDPPRTGAEDGVIDGILALRPAKIAYVSCDPATLARDLKGLIAGGYEIHALAAFDLFPQTHHVETVALCVARGFEG